jgi:lysophospholipase L1-like esterase
VRSICSLLPLYLVLVWGLAAPASLHAEPAAAPAVRVLLLGDSTVIGSVCRDMFSKADQLEDVIRKLLAGEGDLPPVEVLNRGQDGDTVHGLLERYDSDVRKLAPCDFVLIRFGINDSHRPNFTTNFPQEQRDLIKRLRSDWPKCQVVLETIIPYMGEERDKKVNDLIRGVAREEKLPLLDTNARFAEEMKHGHNALVYHRVPLSAIDKKYHALLPAAVMRKGQVIVMDNSLDAHFRKVPGWNRDRHPNLAGYHVIGDETAKFLAPLIRERCAAAKPAGGGPSK